MVRNNRQSHFCWLLVWQSSIHQDDLSLTSRWPQYSRYKFELTVYIDQQESNSIALIVEGLGDKSTHFNYASIFIKFKCFSFFLIALNRLFVRLPHLVPTIVGCLYLIHHFDPVHIVNISISLGILKTQNNIEGGWDSLIKLILS